MGSKPIKGRKRHTVVDTLGLVLRVWVSAANVGKRKEHPHYEIASNLLPEGSPTILTQPLAAVVRATP
jgi:transposase